MDLLREFETGNYSKIVNTWTDSDNQLASDPEAAYIVAAAHFRLGNYETAAGFCEGLQGSFSNNVNFLAMYAAILRRLTLFSKAEEMFLRALKIDSKAKDVRNNYSNLLIDQKRFDDAREVLKKLTNEFPDYVDAKVNLTRLEDIVAEHSKSLSVEASEDQIFGDPLDQAFEVSEVIQCGSKVGKITAALDSILPEPVEQDFEDADLEMLKIANKQIKTKQYNGALELLSKIRKRKGIHSTLYKASSEAMIGLEKFDKAEIFAINAYINGDKSISNLLNLASLSALRKDQLMARHWLIEAKNIDAENELFLQAKSLLFPEGKARDEDKPFA